MAKHTTLVTMRNGFNKVIKDAIGRNIRECFRGAFVDEYGLLWALDGFRAYISCKELDVPMAENPPSKKEAMDLYDSYFRPFEKIDKWRIDNIKPLERPAIEDLKGLKQYDFGEDKPKLDAKFLREALQTFPDAELSYLESKRWLSPVHFNSGFFGAAIILPIAKGGN